MIFACTTIHKKNFCSRKKYPKHQSICDDTECFRDFKFVGCTSVKAAASKWLSFFIFFKNFTYKFFCLFTTSSSMSQLSANHATSRLIVFCDVTRKFCFSGTMNGHLQSINSLKWKLAFIWRTLDGF